MLFDPKVVSIRGHFVIDNYKNLQIAIYSVSSIDKVYKFKLKELRHVME